MVYNNNQIYFSTKITVLPLLVVPVNSFIINLPFPLIVIMSFCFICLDAFISFFPLTNTLCAYIICTALVLEVLAKSDTILSSLNDGTIIFTSSIFISCFLILLISSTIILLF